MNKERWFVYTNEDGIDFYDSEQEAKKYYEECKKWYYDNVEGYWDEADIITWGKVNSIFKANTEEDKIYIETKYEKEKYNNYKILTKDDFKIVISTSYKNPVDYLDEIEEDLIKENYSGKIYFGLTLCNGMGVENEFISLYFDGNKFENLDCKVERITKENKNFVYDYYRDNPDMIENSILNNASKYWIRNGLYNN